jgi:hypothetical protein
VPKAASRKSATVIQNEKAFMHHKIRKLKKQNNFALILLIFSFTLFSFSVYKAFFAENSARKMQTSLQNISEKILPTTDKNTTNNKLEIQSYEEVM